MEVLPTDCLVIVDKQELHLEKHHSWQTTVAKVKDCRKKKDENKQADRQKGSHGAVVWYGLCSESAQTGSLDPI